MSEPKLILKPGRGESVERRHPWIFGGAIARMEGEAPPGSTVEVRSSDGKFLARAAFNAHSQIAGRIWTWDESESVDADFFRRRIDRAVAARNEIGPCSDAFRWVNAENDGLPGLIVDRYGPFAVCQFLSAGAEKWKSEIVGALADQAGIEGVYERSDADSREKESSGASRSTS